MSPVSELRNEVFNPLDKLEIHVAEWRQPKNQEKMRRLRENLEESHKETFIFTDSHNERDNLFVYKLAVADQRLLGLLGFIPYLLTHSVKLCYHIERLDVLRVC